MTTEELHFFLCKMSQNEIKYQTEARERSQKKTSSGGMDVIKPGIISVIDFTEEKLRNKRRNCDLMTFDSPLFEITKHSRYSQPPLHKHSYIELNYVYRGRVDTIINDTRITLSEGDFCLLDKDVPHTLCETTENDIVINFMFERSFFSSTMLSRLSGNSIISGFLIQAISERQLHDRYIYFPGVKNNSVKMIVQRLLIEFYAPGVCAKDIIDACMIIIFSELLRAHQNDNSEKSKNNSQTYIGDILHYIERTNDNCTLETTAQKFGLHPNYLSRLIKEKTNKNFKTIVQDKKLEKACFLLLYSGETVESIIYQCGYQNHSFFYKIFKEKYDISPQEFRRHKGVVASQ